jgi:hypothetical protein
MQVIDNSSVQYKHFFLQGYRALNAGAGTAGTDVEKVAVLVIKQGVKKVVNDTYQVLNDKEVLLTDVFYDPADTELIRLESDIAVTKPGLDIVIVKSNTDIPEFNPPPAKPFFGNVQITRDGVDDPLLSLLNYGWRLRTELPGRRDESGDAGAFVPDVNQPGKLPANFQNSFFNGGRGATHTKLSSGDSVHFEEIQADGNTSTGFNFNLLVPTAPLLAFTKDGVPLDPQPQLEYGVDTVVLDRVTEEVLIAWRAVFLWLDDFESVVLEIT